MTRLQLFSYRVVSCLTVFCLILIVVTDLSSRETKSTLKDVEYATVDEHSLKLDFHFPEVTKDSPLVVWIHGGGWRKGDKANCYVKWLTAEGYTVASIAYRLTSTAVFPAQLHDCKGALRWLRANADKYGYDAERIAVTGSSAGGHLAALLGTTNGYKALEGNVGGNLDQSSAVQAIVDYYGPTDFPRRIKTQPHKTLEKNSVVYDLLGGPADEKIELAKLASSVTHVTADDPPLLIIHGMKDNTVLIGQSESLKAKYEALGIPVALHVLPDGKHGGMEFYMKPYSGLVCDFLDKHIRK